jgi:hypothetical protein
MNEKSSCVIRFLHRKTCNVKNLPYISFSHPYHDTVYACVSFGCFRKYRTLIAGAASCGTSGNIELRDQWDVTRITDNYLRRECNDVVVCRVWRCDRSWMLRKSPKTRHELLLCACAFTCGWWRSEGGRRGKVSYVKNLFLESMLFANYTD